MAVAPSRPATCPLRSPASTAGKTGRCGKPARLTSAAHYGARPRWPGRPAPTGAAPGRRSGPRYGARPRRPGRPALAAGRGLAGHHPATEPGLDGREDLPQVGRDDLGGEDPATEPGLDGREDPHRRRVYVSVETRPLRSPASTAGKTGLRCGVPYCCYHFPLRSPASTAGKTGSPPPIPSLFGRPLRSPASTAGKTGDARTRGGVRHGPATEPGLDGREDIDRAEALAASAAPLRSPASTAGKTARTCRPAGRRECPLRSPASTAGKTCAVPVRDACAVTARYGARPRRPGRRVDQVELAARVAPATEPGLDGREDHGQAAGWRSPCSSPLRSPASTAGKTSPRRSVVSSSGCPLRSPASTAGKTRPVIVHGGNHGLDPATEPGLDGREDRPGRP